MKTTAEQRVNDVRGRIASACTAAGRDPAEITLVGVSKGVPADRVAEILTLGVVDLGENKAQEGAAKAAQIAEWGMDPAPRWHFVGQLQRNKARTVVGFASMVHSVDRLVLVSTLDSVARQQGTTLDVLIQIDLDGQDHPARGGVGPPDLSAVTEAVLASDHLVLCGVMAVAPTEADPRPAFDRLIGYSTSLQRIQPSATVVSAGMSGDLEAAISAGATHVRVGTALFGARKLASEYQT